MCQELVSLAAPQVLLLSANGLGKPLSKAPSGQASDRLRNPLSPVQKLRSLMEMNLPYVVPTFSSFNDLKTGGG